MDKPQEELEFNQWWEQHPPKTGASIKEIAFLAWLAAIEDYETELMKDLY